MATLPIRALPAFASLPGTSDSSTLCRHALDGPISGRDLPQWKSSEGEVLLPGDWVEVLPASEILASLDADQSVEGLPFMPEMLPHCGQRYRVALRADRTCVHPPEVPLRQLVGAVVLEGLRCDGSVHGGCQLGCMLFWKEQWLRKVPVDRPIVVPAEPSGQPQAATLRSMSSSDPQLFFCQATALPRATSPGNPAWKPGQYVRLLKAGTFTPTELFAMFARPGGRWVARRLRYASRREAAVGTGPEAALGLEPGEWVEVKSRAEILQTLDANRMHKGLSFGGDMNEQFGRRMRVQKRVDRIIEEKTGRLRPVHDTVLLEGSICDRYFGCARGMPFLWREVWLKRVESDSSTDDLPGNPPSERQMTRERRWSIAVKRGMDVAGAATAAIVLSPVLAWTALAVAATQGLPILFRHERPGLREKPYTVYKFRTMRPPRRGEVWYMTDEQRISRLGRFLRSTSIDELPELWNVLRGEMSLVGPRPLLTEYLDTYTPSERRRHDMRPGITGWAAVQGRHVLKFEDRLELDVWYVDNWSLLLDLRIIGMTVGQVLRRTDVVTTQDLDDVGFPLPGVGDRPLGAIEAGHDQAEIASPEAPAGAPFDPERPGQ